jgi:hypothetical protein
MASNDFPDVRCGRITEAMKMYGWTHDVVCFRRPPQFAHAYNRIIWNPWWSYEEVVSIFKSHPSPIVHVHAELHGYWIAHAAKDAGKKIILNIHDMTIQRPDGLLDVYEAEAFHIADALVWVNHVSREFAIKAGYDVDKPYCMLTNYVSSSVFIDTPTLPHVGGVCYGGGAAKKGDTAQARDFSPIAEAIDLHVYSGSGDVDYGIPHISEMNYPLYLERLASHDWGFSGYHLPHPSWVQSMPTKVTEYFAAGIPVIAMNTPEVRAMCNRGMGIYCETMGDLKKAARTDPRPYAKVVKELRREYTTERIVEPLSKLYEEVGG